jgi:hypothetical protein
MVEAAPRPWPNRPLPHLGARYDQQPRSLCPVASCPNRPALRMPQQRHTSSIGSTARRCAQARVVWALNLIFFLIPAPPSIWIPGGFERDCAHRAATRAAHWSIAPKGGEMEEGSAPLRSRRIDLPSCASDGGTGGDLFVHCPNHLLFNLGGGIGCNFN